MEKLIISAPFGNYFSHPDATSTLGTFTRHKRAGLLKRIWRVLLTVRYHRRSQSWINKLGLPNPGIEAVDHAKAMKCIVSIHGFNWSDWRFLISWLKGGPRPLAVEMNWSCPNVGHQHVVKDGLPAVESALADGLQIIAKLPPVRWFDYAIPLYAAGVRTFHLCNTIPTPGGGLSGKPLKQYSLWALQEFRQKWGDSVRLIGGGGVSCPDDVLDYLLAGANHVAVGSFLFNPFNWRELKVLAQVAKCFGR